MRISDAVSAWAGKRALVIGDPMDDIYRFGRVERVSQEAPVPVFVGEHTDVRRGGADNVAANLEALGLQVTTCFPERPWTMKLRYMVGHHQLFRVDHDRHLLPTARDVEDIATHLRLRPPDVVVLSDYAKGWLSHDLCKAVIGNTRAPVVVDPKGPHWAKYAYADVICPNEAEWIQVCKRYPGGVRAMILKRGARGLRLDQFIKVSPVLDTAESIDIPAQARHVFDVTGAGDTVVATVAATLAAGGTFETAARLANLAAGIVVGEVGTSVCSLDALFDAAWAWDSENTPSPAEPPQHYPPLFNLVDG